MAKRKNKIIVGVSQEMLHDQGLPLHFWVEACNKVVYVYNRSPRRILGMSKPKEYFSGNKPGVSHLRIFGSSIYCHVTKDARKKIEPTVELAIFEGYTDTPHNYQVYLPSQRMKIVCRDVNFDEENDVRCSLERELQLHVDEDLLTPKEEPLDDVE